MSLTRAARRAAVVAEGVAFSSGATALLQTHPTNKAIAIERSSAMRTRGKKTALTPGGETLALAAGASRPGFLDGRSHPRREHTVALLYVCTKRGFGPAL